MPRPLAALAVAAAVALAAAWLRYGSLDPCAMAVAEVRRTVVPHFGPLASDLAIAHLRPRMTTDRGRCLVAWARLMVMSRAEARRLLAPPGP